MEYEEIFDVSERTDDVRSYHKLSELLLAQASLDALTRHNFIYATPIQWAALPIGLLGFDIVVQAKSGTGKTLVFALLALDRIDSMLPFAQVMIVVPTREIAIQIHTLLERLAPSVFRIRLLVGGESLSENVNAISKGVHIIVGTTGRLCHLISMNKLVTDEIRLFILDEADRLMEDSFVSDVNYLFSSLPRQKQVAVFSATYPTNLEIIFSQYMKHAQLIRLNPLDIQLIGIRQYVVINLADTTYGLSTLKILLNSLIFLQCIVFSNSIEEARKIYTELKNLNFNVALLSSSLSQEERANVLKQLRSKKVRILVSTDLASRGVDSVNINVVFNLGCAFSSETYLHRIGRAGRFGGYGASVTILTSPRAIKRFDDQVNEANLHIKLLNITEEWPHDLCRNETFHKSCSDFQGFVDRTESPSTRDANVENIHPLKIREEKIHLDDVSDTSISSEWMDAISRKSTYAFGSVKRTIFAENSSNDKLPPNTPKKYQRSRPRMYAYLRENMLEIKAMLTEKQLRTRGLQLIGGVDVPFGKSCSDPQQTSETNISLESQLRSAITASDPNNKKNAIRPCSYSRDKILSIRSTLDIDSCRKLVSEKWDVSNMPFEFDDEMRKPFCQKLRVIRQREKKERKEIVLLQAEETENMNTSRVVSKSRFPIVITLSSDFGTYIARLREEISSIDAASSSVNVGPCVMLRKSVEAVNEQNRNVSALFSSFRARFDLEAGSRKEQECNTLQRCTADAIVQTFPVQNGNELGLSLLNDLSVPDNACIAKDTSLHEERLYACDHEVDLKNADCFSAAEIKADNTSHGCSSTISRSTQTVDFIGHLRGNDEADVRQEALRWVQDSSKTSHRSRHKQCCCNTSNGRSYHAGQSFHYRWLNQYNDVLDLYRSFCSWQRGNRNLSNV